MCLRQLRMMTQSLTGGGEKGGSAVMIREWVVNHSLGVRMEFRRVSDYFGNDQNQN